MSEEGGGKLRLKPRKAPPGRSREPSPGREPPARRQTLANRYSWFEQQGLSESENMWMLILKAVNPDLKPTSWETVPSLPEFFGQNSENENPPPKPEVFKVGVKDFQWIPLPSFYKEKALNRKNPSCQISKSQTEHLMEREDQADQNQLNIAPVVEKISLAINDDPGETRSTSAEIKSVDIPKMEGLEEKAEDQRAGALTLDSCPMCLIQFTGTLSQLDIDSHLAKCLSESADDMIW
ncbi:Fanconi anemia core complex-associated protein 20 isoform 4-T4 [Pangshura tecta]